MWDLEDHDLHHRKRHCEIEHLWTRTHEFEIPALGLPPFDLNCACQAGHVTQIRDLTTVFYKNSL